MTSEERRTSSDPATFVLIHGSGDVGWYWHLVEAELQRRGHDVVVMDLPVDDDTAGLAKYTDIVLEAIGERRNLVVGAQSFGGYTAPLVCERTRVELLVLIAAMVPAPGERADEMFVNTGWAPVELDDPSAVAVFYHDVAPELAAEAIARGRDQSDTPGREPWPLTAWPDVATRYLLCRHDRLFPAAWVRKVVRERLGIVPDEIDTGHCPALSRPQELADRLESYWLALRAGTERVERSRV